MLNLECSTTNEGNYKQIDDIIDARKRLGQYNVYKPNSPVNYRYTCLSSANDRNVRFDDTIIMLNEGDTLNNLNVKHTDSEITIVRVKCNNNSARKMENKWDMTDIAIPGDGTHLGDSPSLVNLATLVNENVLCEGDEYLVPLSSWDPCYKAEEKFKKYLVEENDDFIELAGVDDEDLDSDNNKEENSQETNIEISETEIKQALERRPSLARRISKFIRKHCKKSKTLPHPNSNQD